MQNPFGGSEGDAGLHNAHQLQSSSTDHPAPILPQSSGSTSNPLQTAYVQPTPSAVTWDGSSSTELSFLPEGTICESPTGDYAPTFGGGSSPLAHRSDIAWRRGSSVSSSSSRTGRSILPRGYSGVRKAERQGRTVSFDGARNTVYYIQKLLTDAEFVQDLIDTMASDTEFTLPPIEMASRVAHKTTNDQQQAWIMKRFDAFFRDKTGCQLSFQEQLRKNNGKPDLKLYEMRYISDFIFRDFQGEQMWYGEWIEDEQQAKKDYKAAGFCEYCFKRAGLFRNGNRKGHECVATTEA